MSASRFNEDIQPVQRGQRVRDAVNPERLNALAVLAQEGAGGANMRVGPGLYISRTAQGIIVKLRKQIQRKGGGATPLPLDCYLAGASGDALKLQVRPGTIIGTMPTIGGTRLDVGTPPYLVLSATGTHYVVFNVSTTYSETDGIFVNPTFGTTTVTITLTDTDPGGAGLQSDSGSFSVVLATYVDGVKTLQNGNGPIGGELCDTLQGTHTAQLNLTYPGS